MVTEDVIKQDDNPNEELFKYIHPSIVSTEERRQIHCELVNLVHHFPLPEICKYLMQMKHDSKVYLNVKPEAMYAELLRLGMSDSSTPGFSKKNFMNYFNVRD